MKSTKMTIAELCYFIYFLALFGAKSVGLYEGMFAFNAAIVLGCLLFGFKVLMTEHTILEYVVMALLIGMSFIVYSRSGEKGLLLCMTMMLGMKYVSLKRIEKWGMTILGICFPVMTASSILGLIPEKTFYSVTRVVGGEMLRHSFGYPQCNVTHTTFVILMSLIFLVKGYRGKRDLIECAVLYCMSLYVYLYTFSNTGLIASTVLILAVLFFHRNEKVACIDKMLILLLYPFGLFAGIVLPMIVSEDLFWTMDKLLHNRMNYPRYWLTHEPVSLFGVHFGKPPKPNYYIDSSYLYSFLQIGVIPCILLAILMMAMIYGLIKRNLRMELAVVACLLILGLSDPFFYNLSYKNIMFLFAGNKLYEWLDKMTGNLPSVFGMKIQILSIGTKEIEYGNGWLYNIWKKSCHMLDNVISQNGFQNIVTFLILSGLICAGTYWTMGADTISGVIDTVDEWEYVRKALSVGVWGSGIFVITSSNINNSIKKNMFKSKKTE